MLGRVRILVGGGASAPSSSEFFRRYNTLRSGSVVLRTRQGHGATALGSRASNNRASSHLHQRPASYFKAPKVR